MVEIQRIDREGGMVEHTEASRAEVMRALELALSDRSPWARDKQISVIAALRTRLQELDRQEALEDAKSVAKVTRGTAWAGAVAAWFAAVAAIALAVIEYMKMKS